MSYDHSLINGGYGPVHEGGGLVETVDDEFDGYDDNDTVSSSAIILLPQTQAATTTTASTQHSSWNYVAEPQLFRGLSNQGATCYMNSLLQSLYMTPEFRHRLYQSETARDHGDTADLETNIPFQLQKLFAHLQLNKDRKAIDTKALTKSFGWNSSDVFQQHDVQELCRVLFDALEESLKGTPTEHLVNDLYQGQLKDYVQCANCGNESSRVDNFLDLSLVIRPFGSSTEMMKSVEEAIEYFLKPEMLSGENQWDCARCGTKQDAIKGLKFSKLPYMLALQLKRFDFDYTTFNRIKLNNQVRFPKYLNMNTYVHDTTQTSTATTTSGGGAVARKMSLERQELNDKHDDMSPRSVGGDSASSSSLSPPTTSPPLDDDDDTWHAAYNVDAVLEASGPYVYELFSVLIHSGSAMGGHYYAYIKSFEDGQWYNFNDSTVTKITDAEVQTAWGPTSHQASTYGGYRSSGSTCAYMLMYRLVDRSRNEAAIADSQVPSFLKDLIVSDESKRLEKEKEREEKARLIQLKVFADDATTFKTMHISKLTPLSAVTEKACVLFDHITYDPALVRLRSYSEYTKMPQDTYTGREHCSLMQLQLYAHSSLFLEVRSSIDQPWVEYDGTALQLVVRKYEPLPSPHFTNPPFNLQISDRATVEDLVDVLSAKFDLPRAQCRVLHMSANGYWSIQTSILNPADDPEYMQRSLQMDIRLRHGSEVYVEACPSLDTWSDAKDLFETQAHMITIQVKCKDKAMASRVVQSGDGGGTAEDGGGGVTWRFVVDRRDALQVLKDKLVAFLDMPPDTFKLCRGSSDKAQELKALDVSFKNLTLMDNSTLFVAPGRPLHVNEFHVQIQWYEPKAQKEEGDDVARRLFLDDLAKAGDMTWLMTLIVSGEMLVDDVRASVAAALASRGIDAPAIRLRDYANKRMNTVLMDGLKLQQASQLTLYENREFVAQILHEPEHLPRDHMLYNISVFDRSTLTFGPSHEIVFGYRHDITERHWIDVLAAATAAATGLPEATMQFAKPFQTQEVSVLDVEDFTWTDKDNARRHANPHTLGLYGDRLLVSDRAIPLKELTADERAELSAVLDKATSTNVETLYHSNQPTYGPPAMPGYASSYKYAKPKEAALVIRTKPPPSKNAATTTSVGNGGRDSSGGVPVSPGVHTDDDDDDDDDADSKEFERAGGAVLFDDLH
ncbi:hypothetical protein DYB31_005877 [Aphanomyces astaci]|uniref:USP domain-containing protein n=1 Tax=Aphanomyces astaci TaxID=112090 RepID=A0A397F4G9_APHAT|nr:hypothetical protein DYB31_005877 [Aphanomyces astaci]